MITGAMDIGILHRNIIALTNDDKEVQFSTQLNVMTRLRDPGSWFYLAAGTTSCNLNIDLTFSGVQIG